MLSELLHDPVGVGVFLVDLVDGHHDGDIGGLGVADGLNGLRHDAVVRRHHQNGDVGDHGAPGAHGGESLVARGVQEGDGLAVDLDLVSADVLGDAAGLAGGHGGIPDGVQQGGFAVVHVAHDHNDGGPGLQVLGLVFGHVDKLFLDGDHDFLFDFTAHLLGDEGGGVEVDHLGQGGHDAVFHQGLDHLGAGLFHPAGQLAHGDLVGDGDLDGGLFGDFQLEAAHFFRLVLTALVGESGAAPALLIAADLLPAAPLLALHPLALLAAQGVQPLVVLGQVHVAALPGVHQLLLRHPAGGPLDGLSRLLRGLLAGSRWLRLLRTGLLALLRRFLFRTRLTLLSGFFVLGLALGGLGRFFLLPGGGGLRLLIGFTENDLDVGDGMILGQPVEDDGQLPVRQDLHVVLRGGAVLGQNLGDDLAVGQAEILCHLVDSVFFNSQSNTPRYLPLREPV